MVISSPHKVNIPCKLFTYQDSNVVMVLDISFGFLPLMMGFVCANINKFQGLFCDGINRISFK